MSDLVGNPGDQFSHVAAHTIVIHKYFHFSGMAKCVDVWNYETCSILVIDKHEIIMHYKIPHW